MCDGDEAIGGTLHHVPQTKIRHNLLIYFVGGALLFDFTANIVEVLSKTMIIEDHDARNAARLAGLGSVAMIDYLERSGVFFPTKKRQKNRGKRSARSENNIRSFK